MRKSLLILGLVGLLTAAVAAPASAARPTLLSRAAAINAETGEFSTLISLASQYPGIVDALSGKQQLTLFAPTDAAFSGLVELLASLDLELSDLTSEQIATVLTYHVLPGRWSADRLSGQTSLTMFSGEVATVSTNGGVWINDANVIIADVAASNGFIHAIDSVLLPPSILAALTS